MKTSEVDPEEVYFCVGVPDKARPALYSRHRFENIGRNRKDPWFLFGNWRVISDEEIVSLYNDSISHDSLPR